MAGETSAELTIVVRAQDAATKVINGIGRTIGKVLLSPLTAVSKAVQGIFKQFFSLKALLVGGGIIGVIRSVTDGLSTSQTKFKEVFSEATQRGINAVDDAFGRLGASIRATFGNLVGDGAGGIAGFLDGISDWLRDNQDKIRQFVSDLVDSFRELAAILRGLVGKRFSIGDMLFGGGGFNEGLAIQKRLDFAKATFEKQAKRVFQGSFGGGIEGISTLTESGVPEISAAAGSVVEAYQGALKDIPKFTDAVAQSRAEAKATTDAYYAATTALGAFGTIGKKAANIVKVDVAPIIAELGEETRRTEKAVREFNRAQDASVEIIEDYLTVGDAAALVSNTMTDAFEDIIRGTQSVGRAFGLMVSSILGELGRLLVQKSLLNLLASIGGSLFAGAGEKSIPGSTSSGALTPDFDYPQLARASGGPVRNSGIVRVGENGPENVYLPRGSNVEASQRSRAGGGDTYNIIGARDPKATAREVAYERRRSASLRRAFA